MPATRHERWSEAVTACCGTLTETCAPSGPPALRTVGLGNEDDAENAIAINVEGLGWDIRSGDPDGPTLRSNAGMVACYSDRTDAELLMGALFARPGAAAALVEMREV